MNTTTNKKVRTQSKRSRTQDLSKKAIDIKGKKYVLVSDRVIFFNENFPNGSIRTEIISLADEYVLMKAVVTPDSDNADRFFVGHARETFGEGVINQTSAIENAETSAVGRALAMMGIGVIDSIASVDEINKAKRVQTRTKKAPESTFKKKAQISVLLQQLDREVTRENAKEIVRDLTKLELTEDNYDEIIERLRALRDEKMEVYGS